MITEKLQSLKCVGLLKYVDDPRVYTCTQMNNLEMKVYTHIIYTLKNNRYWV